MKTAMTIDRAELADLKRRLDAVEADVKGNAIRSALYVGGLHQVKGMRQRVAVGEGEGGHLREHLVVDKRFDRKNPIVVVGPERGRGPGKKLTWHNQAFYVEFGTRPHLIDPRGRVRNKRTNRFYTRGKKALAAAGFGPFRSVSHPGSTPQPFMRPTFDGEWRQTVDKMQRVLTRHLETHTK